MAAADESVPPDQPGQPDPPGAGQSEQSELAIPPQLDDLLEPSEPPEPAAALPVADPPAPARPPAPADPSKVTNSDPRSAYAVTRRANHLLAWYDQHATRARIGYWVIKIIQLILGAAVPVVAGLHAPAAVTGSLGALIVVLEGIQQLFQFHENWIRYRLSATSVAREKSMYDARVGDYASGQPVALLALRIENIASSEAAAWAHSSQSSPSALSESSAAAA